MEKSKNDKSGSPQPSEISRRNFMKLAGAGTALTATAAAAAAGESSQSPLAGTRLAMVIDLQRCTGCGGCIITCKAENNIQAGVAWASRISKTIGTFPNVRIEFIPTLCNHCHKAPCVRACPTGAMHKSDGDITAHAPTKCIGCKTCMAMCPYDVISRNSKPTHRFWKDKTATLEGCTSAPADVVEKVGGETIPYCNPSRERDAEGSGVRYKGIVEKCTFCEHRAKDGKLPFCVTSCPANARVFGDLNDPNSAVSKLLNRYRPWRLKEDLGTEPKVYYIREFNPGNYRTTKGGL